MRTENITLAPSILAADFSRLADQVEELKEAGISWLHLDVMDGHFVPNITFGPPLVASLRRISDMVLDTHLMIAEPDRYLEAFKEAGSDYITVHQEACPHLHRTIHRIKELGAKAGVAVNPATPASTLNEIVRDVDLILIMSVNPGFGGQRYIKASSEKLLATKALIEASGNDVLLEVDGGIDASTTSEVVRSGANVLVAGTSVFGKGTIAQSVKTLLESISRATPQKAK